MCQFVLDNGNTCQRQSLQLYCYQHYGRHIEILEAKVKKLEYDYEVMEGVCFKYIDKKNELSNKVNELQDKLDTINKTTEEKDKQVEQLKQKLIDANVSNMNINKNKQTLESSKDKIQNELIKLEKMVETLTIQNNNYINCINNKTTIINQMKINNDKYNTIIKFEYIRSELTRFANTHDYLQIMNFISNPANINIMIALFGYYKKYNYAHIYDDMRQYRNKLCHPYA